MDDTRELPEQLESPVSAPEMVEEGCADGIPDERWRQNTDREATRYLAAATQLSIAYAETVVARVMREPFRALAPTFGVDVPVVTKCAQSSADTFEKRLYSSRNIHSHPTYLCSVGPVAADLNSSSVVDHCCLADSVMGTLGAYP